MNLLIVEDDLASLFLLKIYMKKYNPTIYTADTGDEAIKICKENHIDIVLMDIKLMGNISGIETSKLIREFNDYSIIIIQSATISRFINKSLLKNAGFNEYIEKPIIKEDLYKLIDEYFPV